MYIYIYIYTHVMSCVRFRARGAGAKAGVGGVRMRLCVYGWKMNYPEISYPEFCQLIEQENRDPNKALGQSITITVALQFAF